MTITGQTLRDIIVAHGTEVLDKGHSVSRGNFNIKCPLCGAADPGHHMGIRLDNGWWGCWRNEEHRGKSPIRLLVALTGKPVWKIREMLGISSTPTLDTFGSIRDRLSPKHDVLPDKKKQAEALDLPKEFRHAWVEGVASHAFIQYLTGRGFAGPVLRDVVKAYQLQYAVTGTFANRIILPYTYRDNIVTWTARSIHADQRLRYRDLEKEESVIFKDQLLYGYDGAAMGGRTLLVLEGPFDVLKGDWAGQPFGVRCVGLSTNNATDAQMLMIAELSEAFDRVCIAMDTPDRFAIMASHRLVGKLQGIVEVEAFDASTLGKDLGGASIRSAADLLKKLG